MKPATKTGRKYKGKSLNRFTPRRMHIAREMGFKCGQVSEEDQILIKVTLEPDERDKKKGAKGEVVEIPTYRGFERDAVMCVWLCLQPESRIAGLEEAGKRGIEEAKDEMWKWAEKEGVGIGTPEQALVEGIFVEIWQEMTNAQSRPEPRRESKSDDDDDPPED